MTNIADSLLTNALSDLTRRSYQASIDRFITFCISQLQLLNCFPAEISAVVSFIASLFQSGYASATIATNLSAISFVHKINGFADPTASFVIKKLLHGASKLRPSVDYRAPVTKDILHSLVRSAPHVTDCFYNNTLVCSMYLLAFHGFLRIGEIVVSSARNSSVVLQVDQVTVNQTECVIVFHSYKHYQGHPVSLVISPGADVDFCPVKYMQRYLSLRGSAPGPLFVFPGGSPVTRSFFTNNLNRSLIWSGLSPTTYKGHSFRIGAATMASMMGISEEEIQRMGRWRSQAFKKYIRIPMLQLP